MSAFLQNLRQPEYVHVLINHLPLTGLVAAWISLIVALLIRNRAAIFLGMALVALFHYRRGPSIRMEKKAMTVYIQWPTAKAMPV